MKNENASGVSFQWRAHFRDGSKLDQFPDTGEQNKLSDLLAKVDDIAFIEILGLPVPLMYSLPALARPVIFDRRRHQTAGNASFDLVWHFFGYELLLEGGATQRSFLVIHGDGPLVSMENDILTPKLVAIP